MRLYLIRHALPDYQQSGAYHRPPGPPLTAEGQQQVDKLVQFLRGTHIQRIAASPLLRCQMTADPVAQVLNVELETDDDLIDTQPGEKPSDYGARMLRAVVNRCDSQVVALVSHAAPLEQLLKSLTRDTVQLPERDKRGCYLREGSVWLALLKEGAWTAREMPLDGYKA
ncbi:MAG: hypothetical protein NVS4B8_17310 [Herpetosiphon sp.]